MEDGDDCRLPNLCSSFLKAQEEAQEELDQLRNHPWAEVKEISETTKRIARFCRCIRLLCNKDDAADSDIKDLLYFTQYKGNLMFEKNTRTSLTSDDGFYKDQVNEVIKTAASTKTLAPKLDQLKELLGKKSVGQNEINKSFQLLDEVRTGMRKGATDAQAQELLDKLSELAENMMQNPSDVSEGLAKTILDGLDKFSDQPGVLDLSTQLKEFMVSNQGKLASNELMAYLAEVQRTREFDATTLSKVVQSCDGSSIAEDLLASLDCWINDLFGILFAKAGCLALEINLNLHDTTM